MGLSPQALRWAASGCGAATWALMAVLVLRYGLAANQSRGKQAHEAMQRATTAVSCLSALAIVAGLVESLSQAHQMLSAGRPQKVHQLSLNVWLGMFFSALALLAHVLYVFMGCPGPFSSCRRFVVVVVEVIVESALWQLFNRLVQMDGVLKLVVVADHVSLRLDEDEDTYLQDGTDALIRMGMRSEMVMHELTFGALCAGLLVALPLCRPFTYFQLEETSGASFKTHPFQATASKNANVASEISAAGLETERLSGEIDDDDIDDDHENDNDDEVEGKGEGGDDDTSDAGDFSVQLSDLRERLNTICAALEESDDDSSASGQTSDASEQNIATTAFPEDEEKNYETTKTNTSPSPRHTESSVANKEVKNAINLSSPKKPSALQEAEVSNNLVSEEKADKKKHRSSAKVTVPVSTTTTTTTTTSPPPSAHLSANTPLFETEKAKSKLLDETSRENPSARSDLTPVPPPDAFVTPVKRSPKDRACGVPQTLRPHRVTRSPKPLLLRTAPGSAPPHRRATQEAAKENNLEGGILNMGVGEMALESGICAVGAIGLSLLISSAQKLRR